MICSTRACLLALGMLSGRRSSALVMRASLTCAASALVKPVLPHLAVAPALTVAVESSRSRCQTMVLRCRSSFLMQGWPLTCREPPILPPVILQASSLSCMHARFVSPMLLMLLLLLQ